MSNQEIFEFLKTNVEQLNTHICNNPTILFDSYTKRFKNKHLLQYFSAKLTQRLREPWITQEQLMALFPDEEIMLKGSSRGNKYYCLKDDKIKIYSSIIHGKHYYDQDYNMYIELNLQYLDETNSGIIEQNFETKYMIKLDILSPYMMLRLEEPNYVINEKIITNRLISDDAFEGRRLIE